PRGFGFSSFVARKSVLECSIGFVSRTMGIILASREGMSESMPKTRYHYHTSDAFCAPTTPFVLRSCESWRLISSPVSKVDLQRCPTDSGRVSDIRFHQAWIF